jgi:carbon monoxide dehydrogenase subunit G
VKIDSTFDVSLPLDDTWALLLDLTRVAPCLPGAHLDDVVDGEYRGGLSTKIGPINARYTGKARFLERDEVDHRAVIQAQGREERGSGAASATITAVLRPAGAKTRVDLSTEMAISGRAAQFGRSLLDEVSASLINEFAQRLEASITRDGDGDGDGASAAALAAGSEGDRLDVGRTVLLPLLRRVAPAAVTAVLGILLGWVIGRRTARRRGLAP